MTQSFRQKLLNWFCTMLVLLLVCTLSLGLSWRIILTYAEIAGGDWSIDSYAGPLGEAFLPYILFFPLLAIWHFFDLVECDRNPRRWIGWFARYRSFLILILLASPFAILSASDGHLLRVCANSFQEGEFGFYHHCYPPSLPTLVLWLIAAPMFMFACISKAVTAIRSRRADED